MEKSNIALAATISSILVIGTIVSSPTMTAGKEKYYGFAADTKSLCY